MHYGPCSPTLPNILGHIVLCCNAFWSPVDLYFAAVHSGQSCQSCPVLQCILVLRDPCRGRVEAGTSVGGRSAGEAEGAALGGGS
ncbi:hypothetical protein FKM82_031322 [Ascaphus truei]